MAVIIVHGTIRLTPALDSFVRKQVDKIERFTRGFGNNVVLRIELSKPSAHHRKGLVFRAEINCNIPGRRMGGLRAEAISEDLHNAFSEASHEIIAQIQKIRGRSSAQYKKGARELKRKAHEVL